MTPDELKKLKRRDAALRSARTRYANWLRRAEHARATDPTGDYTLIHCSDISVQSLRDHLAHYTDAAEASAARLAEALNQKLVKN